MYRQVTPQANIPNAAGHQGTQGIQQVQDGNHPQVHVGKYSQRGNTWVYTIIEYVAEPARNMLEQLHIHRLYT